MTVGSVAEAYRFVAVASRVEIERALRDAERGSVVQAILRAAIGQFDGDLDGAMAALTRVLKPRTPIEESSYVLDLLYPLMMARTQYARVETLLERSRIPLLDAPLLAAAAYVAALRGKGRAARGFSERALRRLETLDDDLIRARTEGRLAVLAHQQQRYERAIDFALAAARRFERVGALRAATPPYSLVAAIHEQITGDVELARFYAVRYTTLAEQTGERASIVHGVVTQLAIAAVSGDERRLGRLRSRLIALSPQRTFRERFSISLAEMLSSAWSGRFDDVAARLRVARAGDRSPGEQALAAAVDGLCRLAAWDVEGARAAVAPAIARADELSEPHERLFVRLSRLVAGFVLLTTGVPADARRVLDVRELTESPQGPLARTILARDDLRGATVPLQVRGWARAMDAAAQAGLQIAPRAGLTAAEMALLPMLAEGRPATEIARELGRSYSTIRTHVEHIGEKLGVSGRSAIVRRGRELGLI